MKIFLLIISIFIPSNPLSSVSIQAFPPSNCQTQEKGVNFKEIDVSKDQKAAEELVRKTHQMGVPVIQIGSEYVIGFDKKRIDKLLGIN